MLVVFLFDIYFLCIIAFKPFVSEKRWEMRIALCDDKEKNYAGLQILSHIETLLDNILQPAGRAAVDL